MAGDATRGPKLVTTTALVIAAILAYYYWTETNISRELFERMQKLQTDMVNANQTIKDQQVATETQKEQLKKLEDDKKMVEAEKAKVEEEKKKLLEEKTKLEEEKKGWDAKNKEAADNALKLATEKKAAEDKLIQNQNDCAVSCQLRVAKAEEECKKKNGSASRR